MNLVLMPMWLLSGGFFPAPALAARQQLAQQALHVAMRVNPLSYAVAGVRQLLAPDSITAEAGCRAWPSCWLVTIGFAVACFAAAVVVSRQRSAGDLP